MKNIKTHLQLVQSFSDTIHVFNFYSGISVHVYRSRKERIYCAFWVDTNTGIEVFTSDASPIKAIRSLRVPVLKTRSESFRKVMRRLDPPDTSLSEMLKKMYENMPAKNPAKTTIYMIPKIAENLEKFQVKIPTKVVIDEFVNVPDSVYFMEEFSAKNMPILSVNTAENGAENPRKTAKNSKKRGVSY